MTAIRAFLVLALLVAVPVAFTQGAGPGPAQGNGPGTAQGNGQGKKRGDNSGDTRNVQGIVSTADEMPVSGAVVQLKNTKTLQIRSFITQQNGSYYFNGLSTDVDYELKAENHGVSSPVKTLSSFDSRKDAVLNLKLNNKK